MTDEETTNGGVVVNPYEDGCAYIQGEFVPVNKAAIPILDVGFLHSDCTYDVVATWKGNFFRLDDHLKRFQRGWEELHLNPPLSPEEMKDVLMECVRRSKIRSAYVSMIVTRGMSPKPGMRDPRQYNNQFYAFAVPYVWISSPEQQQTTGLHLIVAEKTIRIPSNSVDPTVKNFHWLDMIRGLFEAYERGGHNAVLCDSEGNLTEGPGFNIFCIKDGELYTPARGALLGVTRQTVLDLANELNVPFHKADISKEFLLLADEVFLTSTAGGIMAVSKVNDKVVVSTTADGSEGKPMGPLTLQLYDRYWQEHETGKWLTPIDYGES